MERWCPRILTRYERVVPPYDIIPGGWYALGRINWWAETRSYYPLPIAWAVRAIDAVERWWDSRRSRPTPLQVRMQGLIKRAYARGYNAGLESGSQSAVRVLSDLVERLPKP